jgi:hypothetical protein
VLQCSTRVFPSCVFTCLVLIPLAFEHFVSQLAYLGLVVQPHACTSWSPSSLCFNFSSSCWFLLPLGWHHVWIYFFYFLFFIICIGWKCLPCRCTLKVKGYPSSFWDLLSMFFT